MKSVLIIPPILRNFFAPNSAARPVPIAKNRPELNSPTFEVYGWNVLNELGTLNPEPETDNNLFSQIHSFPQSPWIFSIEDRIKKL